MRADGYLLSRRATLLAMSGVLVGMLLAALNQTIVATALAVTLAIVIAIPELPLRRTVREVPA
jgi:hypothetical protein